VLDPDAGKNVRYLTSAICIFYSIVRYYHIGVAFIGPINMHIRVQILLLCVVKKMPNICVKPYFYDDRDGMH
jgi:hypothetical protein